MKYKFKEIYVQAFVRRQKSMQFSNEFSIKQFEELFCF